MSKDRKLKESLRLLIDLGMPRAQLNERSALCLLALVNMTPRGGWSDAQARVARIRNRPRSAP